jgi:GT2 family glycosyltransferase
MTFTVMISTRDRRADLEATCAKLLDLQPMPDEVIICADGCLDDTAQMLRLRFPAFRVIENPSPRGSVYSRDRMMQAARGDIVLSLDDDSYPLHRDFFQRLPDVFLGHPDAAVVVFPELRDGNRFAAADKTDKSHGHYVSAYANCAAAMRRDFYLRQPGFPVFFRHFYEEPDYASQCYAAGKSVWFEPSLTVRHQESPVNRRPVPRHHFNARNELWSVWLRCPWPWLPAVSAYRILRQFVYACSEGVGWAIREPIWWASALKGWRRCRRFRQPIEWSTYYHWMKLARTPIYSLGDLRKEFPMLRSTRECLQMADP